MNVKSLTLIILINLLTTICFSQNILDYTPLKTYHPTNDNSDLKSLHKEFNVSKIIGMGESTHGTREFFLNRHRIFKYLVENYGFNTFFLEADYANCLRVNKYINGADDNLYEVVESIGMWIWNTQEMAALIEWMRNFNSKKNDSKKIHFIGSDLQKINSTIHEIDDIIEKYLPDLINKSKYPNISEIDFAQLENLNEIKKYRPIFESKKKLLDTIQFEDKDEFIYRTLIRHFEQIIEGKEKQDFFNHRDLKMGENILYHLEKNPKIKGFFWAHNGHIANLYKPHKKENKSYFRAGGVLKNKLKSKYLIIGQDFSYGSFNAYYLNNNQSKNEDDINAHTKGVVSIKENEYTFGYLFKKINESILYIRTENIDKHQEHNYYFNYIGAAYYPPKKKKKPSIMPMQKDYFDIVILIKESSPTKLLK